MQAKRHEEVPHNNRNDWTNLGSLMPFVWEYKGRVLLALGSLLLAKVANVGVPLVLKDIVDALDVNGDQLMVLPVMFLLAYGALKLAASLFNELRDALFAKVRYRAMRRISLRVMEHLHNLSLRFHLERQTGGISRDLERGSRSVSSLLNYMIFQILPVMVEFALVAAVLFSQYDPAFAWVTFSTVILYVVFTVSVTNWRMHFRHSMNRYDSEANTRAVDSLINYETVKYFGNETLEVRRYDQSLEKWEDAAVKSQASMSLLNFGQGAIISIGVTLVMFMAAQGVVDGQLTLGDLVLVNAFLLQLFIPLNFLGVVYRAIRYSLADMDLMFRLLEQDPEIKDVPNAKALKVTEGSVRFSNVEFAYKADRQILFGVDFEVPAGKKLAVVGASGAGKSTLSRLLYRFYDPSAGRIFIDGQDIREVQQKSLRSAIGIVPQDTVLVNDTIHYNIQYARPDATREEVIEAARMASIHDFVDSLPEKYDTVVGERGLKLSGGEKQRVAIARAILKRPRILIFDEATSSLDSASEKAILKALKEVAENHTTLVIAHRLSTIIDADEILVLDQGRIIERGAHQHLLEHKGRYADMWALQQEEEEKRLEG